MCRYSITTHALPKNSCTSVHYQWIRHLLSVQLSRLDAMSHARRLHIFRRVTIQRARFDAIPYTTHKFNGDSSEIRNLWRVTSNLEFGQRIVASHQNLGVYSRFIWSTTPLHTLYNCHIGSIFIHTSIGKNTKKLTFFHQL